MYTEQGKHVNIYAMAYEVLFFFSFLQNKAISKGLMGWQDKPMST